MVQTSQLVVDRPQGSTHPRVASAAYPLDYGHLSDTVGGDGNGIDVFAGSATGAGVVGVVLAADLVKRDVEIKVLIDCTTAEMESVGVFLADVLGIGGLMIPRP